MFEEQVKHSGLLGRVLSWRALNVFYSVKNFKGPMFPGQAIVLRGSGAGSLFGRGSLPNVAIIFRWVSP